LKAEADGSFSPRRRAATYPELTRALCQYLGIVAKMRRQGRPSNGLRYQSSEELILFTATPVWADLATMDVDPMPAKQCFDNAFAMAGGGGRYTEGFALMDGSLPTHHGWITDSDGKAIDPTWPSLYAAHAAREPAKRWSGRVVYMGLAIDRDAHLRWIERTGYPNILALYEADIEELLKLGLDALA
jgi:hypothetical protein